MLKIAAVQMESEPLQVDANMQKVEAFLRQAAEAGAEMVVFPECALTGYSLTAEEGASIAEGIPGPRTEILQGLCEGLNLHTVVGTLEVDPQGNLFNSAVLLGPEGIAGVYRKTHLPYLGIDRYLAAGDDLSGPFTLDGRSYGLLICYDIRFPEPARSLALAGTQAILLPTAWPDKARLYPDFLIRARSEENRVFIIAANHVGAERGVRYLGRSILTAPDGSVLAEGGEQEECLLMAEVDLDQAKRKSIVFEEGEYELDLFRDRRPELYRQITEDR